MLSADPSVPISDLGCGTGERKGKGSFASVRWRNLLHGSYLCVTGFGEGIINGMDFSRAPVVSRFPTV